MDIPLACRLIMLFAGIGKAAVEEFSQLGARVLTCARNESALQAARDEWAKNGLQVEAIAVDVADAAGAKDLVEKAKQHFGGLYSPNLRYTQFFTIELLGGHISSVFNCWGCSGVLHVLVNNVGTNRRKQVLDYDQEDFEFLFNTNVHSALHLSQLCYPLLAAAGHSSIVFNSSVAGGPLAMKSGCIYAMTKGVSQFFFLLLLLILTLPA
jgi:tropinone reductase I